MTATMNPPAESFDAQRPQYGAPTTEVPAVSANASAAPEIADATPLSRQAVLLDGKAAIDAQAKSNVPEQPEALAPSALPEAARNLVGSVAQEAQPLAPNPPTPVRAPVIPMQPETLGSNPMTIPGPLLSAGRGAPLPPFGEALSAETSRPDNGPAQAINTHMDPLMRPETLPHDAMMDPHEALPSNKEIGERATAAAADALHKLSPENAVERLGDKTSRAMLAADLSYAADMVRAIPETESATPAGPQPGPSPTNTII